MHLGNSALRGPIRQSAARSGRQPAAVVALGAQPGFAAVLVKQGLLSARDTQLCQQPRRLGESGNT